MIIKQDYSFKCGSNDVDLSTPLVMGILNLTPDSFFDGGKYTNEYNILSRAETIINEGGSIIDLGAYSTRPGAKNISLEEEIDRLLPAIRAIRGEFPKVVLSVDSFRSSLISKIFSEVGPFIVNDISGGTMDDDMFKCVGQLQLPYIMMHIQGTPQTMTDCTNYDDLMGDIKLFFKQRIDQLHSFGAKSIILDPGFGFAKTLEQNYEILSRQEEFLDLEHPLLIGLSRKSMIFKALGNTAAESLNGTTVLNTMAINKGANILRVHDVKEASEVIKLHSMIL